MVTNGSAEPRSGFDLRHYSPNTKRPSSSPNRFTSFGCPDAPKAVRQFKERLLFLLAGFNAQLNEFDQNAVIAQTPAIRNPFNLLGHGRRKGHTAPDLWLIAQVATVG